MMCVFLDHVGPCLRDPTVPVLLLTELPMDNPAEAGITLLSMASMSPALAHIRLVLRAHGPQRIFTIAKVHTFTCSCGRA